MNSEASKLEKLESLDDFFAVYPQAKLDFKAAKLTPNEQHFLFSEVLFYGDNVSQMLMKPVSVGLPQIYARIEEVSTTFDKEKRKQFIVFWYLKKVFDVYTFPLLDVRRRSIFLVSKRLENIAKSSKSSSSHLIFFDGVLSKVWSAQDKKLLFDALLHLRLVDEEGKADLQATSLKTQIQGFLDGVKSSKRFGRIVAKNTTGARKAALQAFGFKDTGSIDPGRKDKDGNFVEFPIYTGAKQATIDFLENYKQG